MTDPALLGHLRILEAKLDRLTEAVVKLAEAVERLQPAETAHVSGEAHD